MSAPYWTSCARRLAAVLADEFVAEVAEALAPATEAAEACTCSACIEAEAECPACGFAECPAWLLEGVACAPRAA